MEKLVDFNELFNKYFSRWYKKHSDDYTSEQIEGFVHNMYEDFLKTYDASIGCKPYEYYEKFSSDTLIQGLDDMMRQGLSVCDVLTMELGNRKCEDLVFQYLQKATKDDIVMTYFNMLSDMNSRKHIDIMIKCMLNKSCNINVRDLACELLRPFADEIAEELCQYKGEDCETYLLVCDVISNCKTSDLVYSYLMSRFDSTMESILLVAYIAKLGDVRALPKLYDAIESDEINYVLFVELRNAIEALGGEVECKKDFSDDRYYNMLNAEKGTSKE